MLRENKIGVSSLICVRNHVQNHVQYHVQKPCSKNTNIANKNKSFQKMTDPKRDFIVNEFLKTRQIIQHNFLSERVSDLSTQYELSNLFKLVMDMQRDLKEGIVRELKPIREGMKNLKTARTFPQFPSITVYDDDGEEEEDVFIGDIAEQFLRKFAFKYGTDKRFGLRDKDFKFYIGNKEAKIKENNIIVGEKEYAATPGLWELIVTTTPHAKFSPMGIMIIRQK